MFFGTNILQIDREVFFPLISKTSCFFDTEILNLLYKMVRLYNVLRIFVYLSDIENDLVEAKISESEENVGLNKALDTYRKLIEKKPEGVDPLTEKEQENLEKRIKEIETREVIDEIEEIKDTEGVSAWVLKK